MVVVVVLVLAIIVVELLAIIVVPAGSGGFPPISRVSGRCRSKHVCLALESYGGDTLISYLGKGGDEGSG